MDAYPDLALERVHDLMVSDECGITKEPLQSTSLEN